MCRLLLVFFIVFCTCMVHGNVISSFINERTEEIKKDVHNQMSIAANKARSTAQNVLKGMASAIAERESWLDEQFLKGAGLLEDCKHDVNETRNETKASLWSCLQMARVVTDGTDIATGGFSIAADIMGTADNFLQSLTACIIGPSQSASQLVACYLSALGTIATGVAENIEEVEHYITVVRRDVEDIHAAIKLCGTRAYESNIQKINDKCEESKTTTPESSDKPIMSIKT